MKKLLLLLMLIPTICLAKTYDLKPTDAHITFNDDWYVFTPDNIKGNQTLKDFNVTEEYMNDFFTKNEASLDALNSKTGIEFILRTREVKTMNNLSNFKDSDVNELGKETAKKVGSETYELFEGNNKYVLLNYLDETNKLYVVNFYTVVNQTGYTYTIQSPNEFTDKDITDFKNIMKTVTYDIKEEYKTETTTKSILKEATKNAFDSKKILIDALIGGFVGAIAGLTAHFINKKKKKDQ